MIGFNNSVFRHRDNCSGYQCDDGYPEQFKSPRIHPSGRDKKNAHISVGIAAIVVAYCA